LQMVLIDTKKKGGKQEKIGMQYRR
jgi:hypothetical protein